MAKKGEWLENQLSSENARIYNTDRTDVDMEQYAEDVCQPPRKGSCLWIVILLLLAAIALFLYLVIGGGWK